MAERFDQPLRLTLIRHAAATPEQRGQSSDFERALSPLGEHEAGRMAARLRAVHFAPDRIVASSARRTIQTAEAIAAEIGLPLDRIEGSDDLYLASAARWVDYVVEVDDRFRHLALVGHNPGLTDLWDWLTDDDADSLPTCGVARFELDGLTSWQDLAPGCGLLLDFDYPARDSG